MKSDNQAIHMLVEEHKVILQVVEGLRGVAVHLRSGQDTDVDLLREAVAFMREFADRCHHAKEEDLLFPAFVDHGVPLHGCPIDALLAEHKKGRLLVAQLAEGAEEYAAADRDGVEKITEAIDGIVALYPNHIWKEDEMVFPMAERLLPVEARNRLFEQFEDVEARQPTGTHERFHQFANRIGTMVN